jgi:hypothetical protein
MSTRSGSRAAAPNVSHATGTFADLPFAHALVYVRAKRLSGVLDVRAPGQRHAWIVFWRGQVVSVTTTPTVARFGAVVYELGLVDGDKLDATAETSARERRPQADILVERGIITPSQYRQVLEEQMRRRVHHVFTFPRSTVFMFREGRTSATEPAVAIDVLAPVWRGIKDFPPDDRVREVLDAVGDRPLEIVSESALERAELSGAEARACSALAERPQTIAELRATSTLPPERIDLVAYLLVIARCAEPRGRGRTAAASAALWPAVAAPSAADREAPLRSGETRIGADRAAHAAGVTPPAARVRGPADLGVEGVKKRAAQIDDESPFEALGIPDDATVEAARAAFFRLSRVWHPDRLPPELEPVRAEVARIFRHMSDAHRLLTDARGQASGT